MLHVKYFDKSLKVYIQNGTVRKLGYGFIFAFHFYCSILYYFRDKARYWPKIAIFSYPTPAFDALARRGGGPRDNIAIGLLFGVKKPEWYSCPTVKKSLRIRLAFRQNTG